MNTIPRRIGQTALYLFGLWIALSVMILILPWAPEEALMQGARLVALLAGAVAILVTLVGGATGLLGLLGHLAPRDPAPRP